MPKITWTEEDLNFLVDNYHTHTIPWIAAHLNRSTKTVYRKAYRIHLTKRPRRANKTQTEISAEYRWNYIYEHRHTMTIDEIADALLLSPRTVSEYISRMKRGDRKDGEEKEFDHICNQCLYACNGYYVEDGNPVKRDPSTYGRKGYCSWSDEYIVPEGAMLSRQGLNVYGLPIDYIVKCPLYKRG